jgi:hypothetical protein
MRIYNNLNEKEWQRTYAETFFDSHAYHELKTFKKIETPVIALFDYAYDSAKLNFTGNESENPEELAKFHITQYIKSAKGTKIV